MGTNNTEFSLLISAFSLNSTWTPLVGGLLASHLGTTFTSILATGVIFVGPWSDRRHADNTLTQPPQDKQPFWLGTSGIASAS